MKPGLKLTDVGEIPDDWDAVNLGDRASFRTGPFGSALHKSDYTEDGIPVINPMHIIDGNITPTRSMTITEDAAKKLSEFRLKAGQVILGRRGDMGRCAVIQNHQDGWLCGTGSIIIRCDSKVNADYLQRVISSPKVVSSLEQASVGSTMINLNQGTLSKLRIQLPPLPEQNDIAKALSDIDALITSIDLLIAKKRNIKQSTMQQLLTGKTRLPGFSGKWQVKMFGDIVTKIVGGGTPSRANPAFWGNEIPWVTVKDFTTHSPTETQEYITRLGLNNSASHLIPAGTLITATRIALGKAVVYDVDVAINQDLKALFLKTDIHVPFLVYWFENFGKLIEELGSGSTVKGVSLPELKRFSVDVPEHSEQAAIATVLSDMDAELSALEARREKTRALKQGMMQELLTGKTRLI